jgi:KaiC/GvpD/RAD55 family RecA-like ATPase
MMMVIRGGAGTGKTSTSCKIGIQFCLMQKKVLIATVSNAASRPISDHLVTQLAYYDSQRTSTILSLMIKIKDLSNLTTKNYTVLP